MLPFSQMLYKSQTVINSSEKYIHLFIYINLYYILHISGSKHSSIRPSDPEPSTLDPSQKYDNYLTKLQNICTENGAEEAGAKPVYDTVKSSLPQGMSVLPTPS